VPRKTAENTVKHCGGGVSSVVANHRGGGEISMVVTTLMVDVDGSSHLSADSQPKVGWLGLRVGSHPALSLHSSNEPSELSQLPWS